MAQTFSLVVLVRIELTDKFSVTMLSQPDTLVSVLVYVPAAVYHWPFQRYGNWLLQMLALVVPVSVELTVRFNVATLSQPAALISVFVYVPVVE